MPTIDDEIRSKTVAFATQLAVLVRRAALDAVGAALGGGTTEAAPAHAQATVKRGRGRPKKSAAPAPAPAPARSAAAAKTAPAPKAPVSRKPATAKRAAGERRPPAYLADLSRKLGDYIKAHPGSRMEVIAKAIGVPARELRFPVTKLIAAQKVRGEGQKRGTEYFPL
jgi:hypothetical protein